MKKLLVLITAFFMAVSVCFRPHAFNQNHIKAESTIHFFEGVIGWSDEQNSLIVKESRCDRYSVDVSELKLKQGDSVGLKNGLYSKYLIAFGDNCTEEDRTLWYSNGYYDSNITANDENILPYVILIKKKDGSDFNESDIKEIQQNIYISNNHCYLENIKGDLNNDGNIDTTDLSILSLWLIKDIDLSDDLLKSVDIDKDGSVTLADLARYRQYLSRTIPNLFDVTRFVHFSLDDQMTCLQDITKNQNTYTSLFESPYFANLKKLHDKYGCKFTLMVFETDWSFNIIDTTNEFRNEFSNNSDWLKFAYHGPDPLTHPETMKTSDLISNVKLVYSEISRFATENSIDTVPRMSYFSCTKEQSLALKSNNLITGFLTADDDRISNSGLTESEKDSLKEIDCYTDFEHSISYFRSMSRIDSNYCTVEEMMNNLNNNYRNLNKDNIYIIFAHSITTEEMMNRFEQVSIWMSEHYFEYDYPMFNIEY